MFFFVITNGERGASHTRCYVWADCETRARELYAAKYPSELLDGCEMLFALGDDEFITDLSDDGFEMGEP